MTICFTSALRVTFLSLICEHWNILSTWSSLYMCYICDDECLNFTELGEYLMPCEDDLVCKSTNEKIPYFNAPIYLENKQQIGKVDEIFGPIRDSVSFLDSSCQSVPKLLLRKSLTIFPSLQINHLVKEIFALCH